MRDDLLTLPHHETNEDGKVTEHPGYVNRLCSYCGKDYLVARLVAKEVLIYNCGRKECMEKVQ